MAFVSLRNIVANATRATPQQIDEAETRADAVRRRIKQQEKEKEQKEKI